MSCLSGTHLSPSGNVCELGGGQALFLPSHQKKCGRISAVGHPDPYPLPLLTLPTLQLSPGYHLLCCFQGKPEAYLERWDGDEKPGSQLTIHTRGDTGACAPGTSTCTYTPVHATLTQCGRNHSVFLWPFVKGVGFLVREDDIVTMIS